MDSAADNIRRNNGAEISIMPNVLHVQSRWRTNGAYIMSKFIDICAKLFPNFRIRIVTFLAHKIRVEFANNTLAQVEYAAIERELWNQIANEELTVRVACLVGLKRLEKNLYDADRYPFFRNVKSASFKRL
jgi:hypothetical protein